MRIRIMKGSGRAICKRCGKIIEKGANQVVGEGYNDSVRMHLDCLLKDIQEAR